MLRSNTIKKSKSKASSDSDTNSVSSSTTSLSQVSLDSLELDLDSPYADEDDGSEEFVKHENLLNTEQFNKIKNDLSLHSWTVQCQYENYFVDNKVIQELFDSDIRTEKFDFFVP